jgi:DNA polymerase I-like protein with 3'-5' exonuclease and polymerase domains
VQSIRSYASGDRIHCVLNQLRRERDDGGLSGAAFGRLSSEHPNMQQQPARDPEMGALWRKIYIPDAGGEWACLDYSQQEPRLLTHYAALCQCPGAAEAARQYRDDPTTDNHSMMAKLTGLPRKQAKNIFLGLCYGMGSAKLARECGLDTEWIWSERRKSNIEVAGPEAQRVLDRFNERVPYVRALAQLCEQRAKQNGFLTTLLGRRCRFPLREDGAGFDWTYKALNRLIQGGSADQTKAAMVAVDEAGYAVQLQVHDELDLTVANREEARRVADIMSNVVTMKVPSRVDVEVGPSWGEVT